MRSSLTFLLASTAAAVAPLQPVATWPLTSLAPRGNLSKFDHLLVDASTGLLYVSGKAINVLIAVDMTSGRVAKTLDLASPQGLVVSKEGQLWVGSDEGGNLTAVDRAAFTAAQGDCHGLRNKRLLLHPRFGSQCTSNSNGSDFISLVLCKSNALPLRLI